MAGVRIASPLHVGHEPILTFLTRACAKDVRLKVPLRALMYGPPGVGKTSTAQRVASVLEAQGVRTVFLSASVHRRYADVIDILRDMLRSLEEDGEREILFVADEVDNMVPIAQALLDTALSAVLARAHLLMTCNDVHRVHAGLKAHTVRLEFEPLPSADAVRLGENLGLKAHGDAFLVRACCGDPRRLLFLRHMATAHRVPATVAASALVDTPSTAARRFHACTSAAQAMQSLCEHSPDFLSGRGAAVFMERAVLQLDPRRRATTYGIEALRLAIACKRSGLATPVHVRLFAELCVHALRK